MKRMNFLQKFDMFGEPVNLNFRGQTRHKSVIGGVVSLIAFIPILVFLQA